MRDQAMFARPSRYLVAAVASLTLTGQLSTFVHFVAVHHVVCPEHGELVELEHGSQAAATEADRSDGTAVRASGQDHHGHGHDHCTMAAELRQRTTPTQLRAVTDIAPEPVRLAPPAVTPRPAALALLRVAPKSSPPA
jgi:hypothetical protein